MSSLEEEPTMLITVYIYKLLSALLVSKWMSSLEEEPTMLITVYI